MGKGGELSWVTLGCEMKVVVPEGRLQLIAGDSARETSRWELPRGGAVGGMSMKS